MIELMIFVWAIGAMYALGALLDDLKPAAWYGWITGPLFCVLLWPMILGGLRR